MSAQHRTRYYWGNLPSLQNKFQNDGPSLQEYLSPNRRATVSKIRTVTTRSNSLKQGMNLSIDCLVFYVYCLKRNTLFFNHGI